MPIAAWSAKYGSNADFRNKADRRIAGMIPGIKAAIRVYDWASPDGGASAPPAGGASQAGACNFNMGGEILETRDMVHKITFSGSGAGLNGNPYPSQSGIVGLHDINSTANSVQDTGFDIRNRLDDFITYCSYFTLNQEGLEEFQQARLDGKITGDGLLVQYQFSIYSPPTMVVNPELLVGSSPTGDYVFNLFEVILDILNNASVRPGYLP